jgi:hypothetical protein
VNSGAFRTGDAIGEILMIDGQYHGHLLVSDLPIPHK